MRVDSVMAVEPSLKDTPPSLTDSPLVRSVRSPEFTTLGGRVNDSRD